MMTLRELRVWHWREALSYRRVELDERDKDSRLSKIAYAIANFHIKAVQALNDCPELRDTTAEFDAQA